MVSDLESLLKTALTRRATLLAGADTDVARVFHGGQDGIPGLVLERLGPVLIVQLHEGVLTAPEHAVRNLCAIAAEKLGTTAVYRKRFPPDRSFLDAQLDALHRDPTPWLGTATAEELTVREAGVAYRVRPYDGYSTGLFLDHREHRARVRILAAGRRVLNTFAYTCAASVVAALSGATETVSVDVSKRALEWGKRNFAANDRTLDGHWFICSDVRDYFRRAARQQRRFDLIILDPPTFARSKAAGRTLSIPGDLPELLAGALERLAPGGQLLLSINHRGTTEARLEQHVRQAAAAVGRTLRHIERLPLPEDFRDDPEFMRSILVDFD